MRQNLNKGLQMLFDHDPEIGAILLLNLDRAKIEGYLYRLDEIKQTQDFDREDPKDASKRIKGKEDVVVSTDWYVMDCQGNWFNIKESTNPFLYFMPYFVSFGYADDKSKIDYPILCDWILNLYHGEPSEKTNTAWTEFIPHTELTDQELATMSQEQVTAYYDKFRINKELLNKSAAWITQAMSAETDEEKASKTFDGKKKLLRKLDEFEYDIGDKKN